MKAAHAALAGSAYRKSALHGLAHQLIVDFDMRTHDPHLDVQEAHLYVYRLNEQ
jgi:hypothetical protein